ncbi:MAG: DUF4249 family protein [Ignavibacteriales bacterium]|nr:DUF4249 family protein [Ignavibacteriales bacterium]
MIACGVFGCNQPFNPRGPLENDAVVFSVLSTDRNLQFVRVEHTYMPVGFDALAYTSDNFIPNAIVTIQKGDSNYAMRDTTFARPDTSRYIFPIRAYYARPLEINYGSSYRLSIRAPELGQALSTIRVPDKPFLMMIPSSIAVLQSPGSHEAKDEVIFTVDLGSGARGWIGRFYIYYSVLKNGQWIEERTIIPLSSIFPKVFTSVVYAEMSAAGYKNRSAAVYRNDQYQKALLEIAYRKYPNFKITFTRAMFELVQVEENLYNYYEVAHANGDPLSVRLDEPLYTNVVGGVGVFGAYTLDSLVQELPDNFIWNKR